MLIRYGSSDVCSSVLLELSNEVRGRTGVMLLEETLPFVLGSRPRFVLGGLRAGARRSVTYQVRSDVRGRFLIGPLTVRLRDPFGLVEVGRSFPSTLPLTVPPRTISLPPVPLNGDWPGASTNRPLPFPTGSAPALPVPDTPPVPAPPPH